MQVIEGLYSAAISRISVPGYTLTSDDREIIRAFSVLQHLRRHDFVGAREILEQHVMPVYVDNQLLNRHLDVRAQYAVVLAYCGLYSEAEREMERLQPYAAGLAPLARMTLANQRQLIAEIKTNPIPQWREEGVLWRTPISAGAKIGRNQPCPCGSGKKFKKCGCGFAG